MLRIFVYILFILANNTKNMIKLTNIYRRMHGLKELEVPESLRLASELQANTMCKEMKMTHKTSFPDRRTLKERLEYFNYKGYNIGENIAKQQNDDFKEVFKVWSKSDLHKKNLLGDYNNIGVATCVGNDNNRYWVQVFGKGYVNWKGSKNNFNNFIKENDISNETDNSKETDNNKENDDLKGQDNTNINNNSKKKDNLNMFNLNKDNEYNISNNNYKDEDNLVFLIKDTDDINKFTTSLPENIHLKYKGTYKKYIGILEDHDKNNNINNKNENEKSNNNEDTEKNNSKNIKGDKKNDNKFPPSVQSINTKNDKTTQPISSNNRNNDPNKVEYVLSKILDKLEDIKGNKEKLGSTSSKLEPTSSKLEPTSSKLESISSKLEPTSSKLDPTSSKLDPTSSKLDPTSSKLDPTSSKLDPTSSKLENVYSVLSIDSPNSTQSLSSTTSSLPTITTTVVKTIFNYKTPSTISDNNNLKTITLSYLKNPEEQKKDNKITMTVNLDELHNKEENKNIKLSKLLSGIIKKSNIEEESSYDEYLNNLLKDNRNPCKSIDIGDPYYQEL